MPETKESLLSELNSLVTIVRLHSARIEQEEKEPLNQEILETLYSYLEEAEDDLVRVHKKLSTLYKV